MSKIRVAIIGGGPGGLFSAWHLNSKLGAACDLTIFEAEDRVGGKILTKSFPGAGIYEAGVAEIYDYSALGPDPLKELITEELGLTVRHIGGDACVLDGRILHDASELEAHYGAEAARQALRFREKCAGMQRPEVFYFSERNADNAHPWARKSADQVLREELTDPAAARYIHVMSHSDVAAPPHMTNGLTLMKNVLMDVDGFLDVISVDGGNSQIVEGLVEQVDATILTGSRVKSVQPLPDGSFSLRVVRDAGAEHFAADYVIAAVPLTALSVIEWRSLELQDAIGRHVNHFDRPGHYLRATLLFEREFWREHISGDWWMSDAFDGCCVYDEGARQDLGRWGALGFLITGNAALNLANMSDDAILELCLGSLPEVLGAGRDLFVDGRVHRWMASVNAMPGGYPVRERRANHRPLPDRMPGLLLVGDYMFDATVNGVLDSADTATDMITSEVLLKREALRHFASISEGPSGEREPAQAAYRRFFPPEYVRDFLATAWGLTSDAKILLAGPDASELLEAFRAAGLSAYSVAGDPQCAARVPQGLAEFHATAQLDALPYGSGEFDVVIETGLCFLTGARILAAIAELRRVSRGGVLAASVNSDLSVELLERYDLLRGVRTLISRWDWADLFLAAGLRQALSDPPRLSQIARRTAEVGLGAGLWYEDAESILYSAYTPDPDATRNAAVSGALQDDVRQTRITSPDVRPQAAPENQPA